MKSGELYTDFQPLIDNEPAIVRDDAWLPFQNAMKNRAFGGEALQDAWAWFRDGFYQGWCHAGGEP